MLTRRKNVKTKRPGSLQMTFKGFGVQRQWKSAPYIYYPNRTQGTLKTFKKENSTIDSAA